MNQPHDMLIFGGSGKTGQVWTILASESEALTA